LAKRKAQLEQLQETEPKRLFWFSFIDLSGDADDMVVHGATADHAYVIAARLLDDPRGQPLVFEVPADLYHGPVCEFLSPDQLEHVARLASGTDADSGSPLLEPERGDLDRAQHRSRSKRASNKPGAQRGRT